MTKWTKDEMVELLNLTTEARIRLSKEMSSSYGNLEILQGLQYIDEPLKKIQALTSQVIDARPERRDA